ncbi:hypothetical protein [Streptomyces benahoarensis]|uniref:Uncharacterized protein n=1 Tax=Streptomyces benahoarensis TaxID=2595054 RepID=A0A553Z1E4_9ACTN|nr:hypothetical protein [Streptomyces benahoarensis]TSB21509.1 hypothetical protein FNJ62_18380 [Streptomyces benahoarensis]TSB35254.1 hypothetical protein FNZ23_21395 [Streptomyces benahoarensis]
MGIESEQLVFDYLSRVGDLAQQRGLPSGARMRLVADLRAEATSRIAGQKSASVSQVKRVLARLGTPEAVVSAAESAAGVAGRSSAARAGDGPAAPPVAGAPSVPPGAHAGPSAPLGTPEPPATSGLSGKRASSSGLSGTPGPTGTSGPAEPPTPLGSADAPESSDPSGPSASRPSAPAPTDNPADGEAPRAGDGASGKVPSPRDGTRDGSRSGQWSGLFKKKDAGSGAAEAAGPRFTLAPGSAAPPHLAGADELGDGDADWWLARPEPTGRGETVPGFVGGIEIPEMWKRPGEGDDAKKAPDGTPGQGAGPEPGRPLPGLLRRALGRKQAAPAPEAPAPEPAAEEAPAARVRLSPVVTLAVVLLLAGVVLGSWLALAAGWAVTFLSRRLTHAEAKFAALGVPGLLAGGGVLWMWGRATGRWGDPIASGKMGAALLDGLPLLVRVAAVASAVFLVWRMRRWVR